jgi:putative Mg2+ transporter-C (MgtC) family protein
MPSVLESSVELHLLASLVLAALLGALVGIDRSMAGKHAGMRTYALVSLGSCLFTLLSTLAAYQFAAFAGVNPLQIAASVIIGIGFIGTGLAAIPKMGGGEYSVEITTASGVWVVAAIGMACAYNLYILAIAATIISLLIFSFFARIEHWIVVGWGPKKPRKRTQK